MRLIYAEELKKIFKDDSVIGNTINRIIDEQPTAYDVDKVVEKASDYYDLIPGWALKEIIEIVKSGGIE